MILLVCSWACLMIEFEVMIPVIVLLESKINDKNVWMKLRT